MKFTKLEIEGVWLIESLIWEDTRGNFREWFKKKDLIEATGINFNVQQANISKSEQGTVRGIHYSLAQEGQSKWVTCATGRIKDIVVDIRVNSKTFGQYVEIDLAEGSGCSVLIDAKLGHGFISLEKNTIVSYLLSSSYSPNEEYTVNPLDPSLAINWGFPTDNLILSPKDSIAPSLGQQLKNRLLPI